MKDQDKGAKPEVGKYRLTLQEVDELMSMYGFKCERELVQQWFQEEDRLKGMESIDGFAITPEAVYEFLDALTWKGCGYEKDIDDQTKINRLIEENKELRRRLEELEEQKMFLEFHFNPKSF